MLVAVDVGFGRTKGLSSSGRRIDFPSAIGSFRPIRFTSGMEERGDNLAIDVEGQKYFVGRSALSQSEPIATIDPERTVGKEGMILLSAALHRLVETQSENIQLVVGLPVVHYEKLKESYQRMCRSIPLSSLISQSGEVLSRRFFSVDHVKVIPQPLGTIFDALLDSDGQLADAKQAEGKIGVVDIGYNTLDLARVDRLELVNPRSTSFSGLGLFSAYRDLSDTLYRIHGVEVPPEKLESVVRLGSIKVRGKDEPIIEHWQKVCCDASSRILSRILSVWPDRWELDTVILSGGGALALGGQLVPQLGLSAVIAPNPSFANVSGYLKFARRAWGPPR